jgi:hypothetical protein
MAPLARMVLANPRTLKQRLVPRLMLLTLSRSR